MPLLKKLFGFDSRTMSLQKEVTGGVTTFLTMSYILAVNPAVLSETGMDANALFTTTVLASVLATVMMAVYAKMPFALAPSMGVSAFFVYTIVMEMGYTWQFGLAAVFIEGIIFIYPAHDDRTEGKDSGSHAVRTAQGHLARHRALHCINRAAQCRNN